MRYVIIFTLALMIPLPSPATEGFRHTLTLADARHLLNRTGFGASPYELLQLAGKTRAEAIDHIINGLGTDTTIAMPEWTNQAAPHHWSRSELSKTERRIFNDQRDQEIATLRLWWVREMLETRSPQSERLILFWHNHFTTAYSAINNQAISVARQHKTIRESASGSFRSFLKKIIRDPAMLNYLDNNNNKKASPNENLARELLELFTLGEGNYTEQDVKNSARSLTGYSSSAMRNMSFRFRAGVHDTSTKVIFGHTGHFNGDDLIDLILQQPQASYYLSGKMWNMLVSHKTPTQHQLDPIADRFRRSDFSIKTLYRAILESDDFWAHKNRATIVRSPAALTIGAIRSTGIVPATWQTLPATLRVLGQDLFDPPNVAGWPGGAAWVTPGKLLSRLEWTHSLASCNDKDCAMKPAAAMQNGMSGSMGMTMKDPASLTPVKAGEPELKILLAAEDFEGPVEYNINILQGENNLWSSGRSTVLGGHDTKRFGRARKDTERPWQTVTFPLNRSLDGVYSIEVEFLNDHARDGGDRNLYVKWVSIDDKLFSASNGIQISSCPPKNPLAAGDLYCQGKVVLANPVAATRSKTPESSNTENTIKASTVYAWHVENPDLSKPASLTFALTDVEFEDRRWQNMKVQFHIDQKGRYKLRLNSHGCWPDCLLKWPQCGWQSADEPASRSLTIKLSQKQNKQCQYNELMPQDQRLIDALWPHALELYQHAGSTDRLRRHNLQGHYKAWQPHINNIARYSISQSDTLSASRLVLTKAAAVQAVIDTDLTRLRPKAAGRSELQWQADLDTLLKKYPTTTLQQLLLPTNAVSTEIANNASLADVLSDLAFQLQ
ncbi:hypothetical protein AB833_04670 [Chromatiales bacterium (ex Bugula neritina AB1)]|nr:hypothetical protein AB833_04670 [Chromatiales bacterium (ex Bugula neritina AB1)]